MRPSAAIACEPFTPSRADLLSAMTVVWNDACGPALAVSERFLAYNTRPATGAVQAGHMAREGDRVVGFVLASTLPDNPTSAPPELGWIDAVAVLPAVRERGIGTRLLAAAEEWLRSRGCTRARLGGSLHPFVPGYPVELRNERFFRQRGYGDRDGSAAVWDMVRDLGDYPARSVEIPGATIRPMENGDRDAVRAFFEREFPNRWLFEFEEFWRDGGRACDYVLLLTARGVDGFARLTLEDSERPIDRFHLNGLVHPWGQLGPIGVSKDMRGHGYGGLLLDRSLLRLHEHGVRGCVIDWTGLVDLYARFGFKPYREYAMLMKGL